MKVVGTVSPEEVPEEGTRKSTGVWTGLAQEVVEAHRQGRVLVVTLADRQEHRRMVNGVSESIRSRGYTRAFSAVDEADGTVRAYLALKERSGALPSVMIKTAQKRQRAADG